MARPKKIIHADCEYCGCQRAGVFFKTFEYYDHYLCEEEDADGTQHTFAVLNEEGLKAQKIERRNEKIEKGLKIGAAAIILKEGVEYVKNHIPHHGKPTSGTGNSSNNDSSSMDSDNSGTGTGSLLDDATDAVEWIVDGLRNFFR